MESPAASPGPLVLASGSPRRAELLRQLGLCFEILPLAVDEEAAARAAGHPRRVVLRRAVAKAVAARPLRPRSLILAADTVVVAAGRILGKPADGAEAARMLRHLSGRTHAVWTALVLLRGGEMETAVEYAKVTFRRLDDAEIRRYAAGAEPLDKAGGYAIQGGAAAFVRRMEGEYTTVVGLPLCRLSVMLRRWGVEG